MMDLDRGDGWRAMHLFLISIIDLPLAGGFFPTIVLNE